MAERGPSHELARSGLMGVVLRDLENSFPDLKIGQPRISGNKSGARPHIKLGPVSNVATQMELRVGAQGGQITSCYLTLSPEFLAQSGNDLNAAREAVRQAVSTRPEVLEHRVRFIDGLGSEEAGSENGEGEDESGSAEETRIVSALLGRLQRATDEGTEMHELLETMASGDEEIATRIMLSMVQRKQDSATRLQRAERERDEALAEWIAAGDERDTTKVELQRRTIELTARVETLTEQLQALQSEPAGESEAGQSEQQVKVLRLELAEANGKLRVAESIREAVDGTNAELAATIETLRSRIHQLELESRHLQGKLDEKRAEVASFHGEMRSILTTHRVERREFRDLLRDKEADQAALVAALGQLRTIMTPSNAQLVGRILNPLALRFPEIFDPRSDREDEIPDRESEAPGITPQAMVEQLIELVNERLSALAGQEAALSQQIDQLAQTREALEQQWEHLVGEEEALEAEVTQAQEQIAAALQNGQFELVSQLALAASKRQNLLGELTRTKQDVTAKLQPLDGRYDVLAARRPTLLANRGRHKEVLDALVSLGRLLDGEPIPHTAEQSPNVEQELDQLIELFRGLPAATLRADAIARRVGQLTHDFNVQVSHMRQGLDAAAILEAVRSARTDEEAAEQILRLAQRALTPSATGPYASRTLKQLKIVGIWSLGEGLSVERLTEARERFTADHPLMRRLERWRQAAGTGDSQSTNEVTLEELPSLE